MNRNGRTTSLNGCVIVGATVLIAAVLASMVSLVWGMGARPPVVGMIAPDFSLSDLSGRTHTLKDFRGKIVLVNFWATWCKPCTTEMPAMQAAYNRLRSDGLVVLAINELEDTRKVVEHIREHGHTFPVLLDQDNRVANQYGVFGLPVSVFIDETGRIGEYIKGGLLTEQKIDEVVKWIKTHAEARAVERSTTPRGRDLLP